MTEQVSSAPSGAAEPAVAEILTPSAPAERSAPNSISATEAGRILNAARLARTKTGQEQPPAAPQEGVPAQESAPADAAPPAEDGATSDANPAPEEPPIEPPRSWTADEKDAFRALPREHQARIAERERARDTDIGRRQNEVSEKSKAADAERQAMAEARGKYEAALPQLFQHLTSDPQWADIRTMADVERLAAEDWPRAVQWQIHQQKVAAVQQEMQQAQARQAQEHTEKWTNFAKREDELFLEKAPELKDASKAAKMRDAAVSLLKDIGFSDQDLSSLWNSPALRDHRMQLMLLDAVRHSEAKKAAVNATKKPLPPVQRPGVANANKGPSELVKDLEAKVDRSSGINALRAARDLVVARRQSR